MGNNFPPIREDRDTAQRAGEQLYAARPADVTDILAGNCAAIGVRIGPSRTPAAGLGLFACKAFAAGAVVGWMWGKLLTEEDWQTLKTTGHDEMHRQGDVEDFAEPVVRGVWCCITVDLQASGADHLLASRLCPMAYINHSANAQEYNVSLSPDGLGQVPTSERYKYFPIRATRAVVAGEELMADYHWAPKDWKEVRRRMNKSEKPSRTPAALSSLHTDSNLRSLMESMPPYSEVRVAQRRNILTFLHEFRHEFARQQRYHPVVEYIHGRDCAPEGQLAIRPSRDVPGIMGCFVQDHVEKSETQRRLGYYTGFLMTSDLANKFHQQYHCPTTVRVQRLDYRDDEHDRTIAMDLIGDPTVPAVCCNDGSLLGHPSNCVLETIKRTSPTKSLFVGSLNGKIVVSAALLSLNTLKNCEVGADQELWWTYGKEFWLKDRQAAEYCVSCFSKRCTPANPLIQCEGAERCDVSRHQQCFPPSVASLSPAELKHIHFFCPKHLLAARDAMRHAVARRSAASSVIKHRAAAAPLPPGLLCTPPSSASMPSPPPLRLAVPGTSAEVFCTPPAGPPPVSVQLSARGRPQESLCTPPFPLLDYTVSQHLAAAAASPPPTAASSAQAGNHALRPMHSRINAARSSSALASAVTVLSERGPSETCTVRPLFCTPTDAPHDHMQPAVQPDPSVARPAAGPLSLLSMLHASAQPTIHSCSNSSSSSRAACRVYGQPPAASAGSFNVDQDMLYSNSSLIKMSEQAEGRSSSRASSASEVDERTEGEQTSENSSFCDTDGSVTHRARSRRVMPDSDLQRAVSVLCPAAKCPKLSIRTSAQTHQLPAFGEHHAPVSAPQLEKLRSALGACVGRHWFAKRKKHSSVLDSLKEMTPAAGEPNPAAQDDVNRWRSTSAIAFDWAEYRSCCGAPSSLSHSMSEHQRGNHPSNSLVKMFQWRIKCRASATNRVGFSHWVQETLSHSVDNHVALDGGRVCVSCFRAVLGAGRTSIYGAKNLPQFDALLAVTSAGTVREPRSAPKLDSATTLLMKFVSEYGQFPPNPRGSDLATQKVVLPYVGELQLREALNADVDKHNEETEAVCGDVWEEIKKTTLTRAIANVRELYGMAISIRKSKELCRCTDCDALDNERAAAGTRELKVIARQKKKAHLKEVNEQRQLFDNMKTKALLDGLALWCITFDGMDQSKTKLPNKKRLTKVTDELIRLGVHVIGAFCFGGPVRVMGLLNYPDLKKDSNLSCTTFERILDIQYEALIKKLQADRLVDPQAMLAWPARVHVTFDNAPAEAKNQWFFRFVGLFVLHGVFDCISISNLLVGHTHDIVDQMFSVWSKLLRINNAETYNKMRDLFHKKYHSRVKALIKMIREKLENVSEEDAAAIEDDDWLNWSPHAADALEKFAAEMQTETGIAPEIVLQTFSLNIKGWMTRLQKSSSRDGGKDAGGALTNLLNAHCFGIERDDSGDVYLYNKFLAKSELVTKYEDQNITHHYPNQKTGSYTTRRLLWRAADASHMGSNSDPDKLPPVQIDTAILRDTMRLFGENGMFSADGQDARELSQTLKDLDDRYEAVCNACPQCKHWSEEISKIGVISKKKEASEEQKAKARISTNARNNATNAFNSHLQDPDYAQAHSELHAPSWFTKWISRVRQHIRPAFNKRGVTIAEEYLSAPYHLHPTQLCTGRGEKPISNVTDRVDSAWLQGSGPPKVGHLLVLRSNDRTMPFMMGIVTALVGTGHEAQIVAGQQQETMPDAGHAIMIENDAEQGQALARKRRITALSRSAQPAKRRKKDDDEDSAYSEGEGAASDSDFGDQDDSDSDDSIVDQARDDVAMMDLGESAAAKANDAQSSRLSEDASWVSKKSRWFGRAHNSDKNRCFDTTEGLPAVKLHWFDVSAEDCTALKLLDDNHWDALYDQHAPAASSAAAAAAAAGHSAPAPGWLVDMYERVKWYKKNRMTPADNPNQVHDPSTFILWGRRDTLLKADKRLRKKIFDHIRQDLTEEKPGSREHKKKAPAPSAAVARAVSARARGKQKEKTAKPSRRFTSAAAAVPSASSSTPPAAAAQPAAKPSRPSRRARPTEGQLAEGEDENADVPEDERHLITQTPGSSTLVPRTRKHG